jgi:hypothetical protein
MTATKLGSVVIPAHNEAAVIGRCLDTLLAGFGPGELDVIVACNGCTDGTADLVHRSGHPVRVIEMTQAAKARAIRSAEAQLATFPRLYLDADVELSSASARRTLESLRAGRALAARPPIRYDWTGSAPLVRSYYRARTRMPAVMGALWGAGVYGLSEAGRRRFGEYPDVVGEDLFVDRQFARTEIEIVAAPPVVVRVPRRVADLVHILRRAYQGKTERRADQAGADTTRRAVRDLLLLAGRHPARALDSISYAGLAIWARLSLVVSPPSGWERDESSRTVPG